jgi:hypothetical protein
MPKEMFLMIRKCIATVVALILAVGGLLAEDVKGIFKKYEDGKVTITVDDKDAKDGKKDVTYKVDPNAKTRIKGKDSKYPLTKAMSKNWKAGDAVTLTIDKDKELVTVGSKNSMMKKPDDKPKPKDPSTDK